MTCCGTQLRTDAGIAQTTPCLGLDGQKKSMTNPLWLQVEQLNRDIAHAWEGLRQQPGGLHCIDMLVRRPLPLSSGPILHHSWTAPVTAPAVHESQQTDSAIATPALTLDKTACDLHY